MGDLIKREASNLPKLPSFVDLEKIAGEMAKVRLAAAEDTLPSKILLERVEELISRIAPTSAQLAAQASPAPIGLVATYLGLLLKAYPNAGDKDARIFGRLLRDDVHSLDAPEAAIEIACRRWRQKSKYLPSISELMAEVRIAKVEMDGAREFAARLPALRQSLADQ